jgi:hypothetical protein
MCNTFVASANSRSPPPPAEQVLVPGSPEVIIEEIEGEIADAVTEAGVVQLPPPKPTVQSELDGLVWRGGRGAAKG